MRRMCRNRYAFFEWGRKCGELGRGPRKCRPHPESGNQPFSRGNTTTYKKGRIRSRENRLIVSTFGPEII